MNRDVPARDIDSASMSDTLATLETASTITAYEADFSSAGKYQGSCSSPGVPQHSYTLLDLDILPNRRYSAVHVVLGTAVALVRDEEILYADQYVGHPNKIFLRMANDLWYVMVAAISNSSLTLDKQLDRVLRKPESTGLYVQYTACMHMFRTYEGREARCCLEVVSPKDGRVH